MLREMATRFGSSPGGYLWALVQPMGWIVILAVAFGLVARAPSLGNSFILFYATGFLPFNIYNSVQPTVMRSLNFSKPLLKYPAVTWIDAILARFLLNTLTETLVFFLLIFLIRAVVGINTPVDFLLLLQSIGLAAALGLSVGTLTCFLLLRLPVFGQIWPILMRPLFLISGVLFMYEDLPRVAQDVLIWNPLMHITSIARAGMYPTYSAHFVSYPFIIACSLIPLFFGLLLLRKHSRELLTKN
ncbi:MAG: ABC transporter permease [Maritimibacter sp.]